jgi:hypothetical protein
MGELDADDRAELKDSQFAYVTADGERKLPIPDEDHVRNAIQRFGQTDFNGDDAAKRDAARTIIAKADEYGIEVGEDDEVQRALT